MSSPSDDSVSRALRFALPPSLRLKHSGDFDAVYEARTFRRAGPLTIHALPNERAMTRLGLSVPRSAGKAVVRNRIKRLLREAFRHVQHELPRGYDVVVSVRSHTPLSREEYQRMLAESIAELDLIWSKRQRKQTNRPGRSAPGSQRSR